MEVKIKNDKLVINFDSSFDDVIEFLGAKRGIINTNITKKYSEYDIYISYTIAYYELDLEHTYSKEEVKMLVDTNKIVLLDSKPYMVSDDEIDTDKSFSTLKEYDYKNKENNSENNNKLVLKMLNKYKNDICCKKR